MGIYLNDWKDCTEEYVFSNFDKPESEQEGVKIILASYTYEDYNGDAFVLFEKGGILYEVNGGHCSCYGLEGQWEPEETTLDALSVRKWGSFGVTFDQIKEAIYGY